MIKQVHLNKKENEKFLYVKVNYTSFVLGKRIHYYFWSFSFFLLTNKEAGKHRLSGFADS